MPHKDTEIQRQFYARTAERFDEICIHAGDEHFFALGFMTGMMDYLRIESVLDVGAGTGRALLYLKENQPGIRVLGIEPVAEQRAIGYKKGLSPDELTEGNATALTFNDGAFDLVCAFGVLHHIKEHRRAVAEMLRVAKRVIFISDANNLGQGAPPVRLLKQVVKRLRLWGFINSVKTGGKGYYMAKGDGLFYSYSVFDDYPLIRKHCASVHCLNTKDAGINLYTSAGHIALLGIKKLS